MLLQHLYKDSSQNLHMHTFLNLSTYTQWNSVHDASIFSSLICRTNDGSVCSRASLLLTVAYIHAYVCMYVFAVFYHHVQFSYAFHQDVVKVLVVSYSRACSSPLPGVQPSVWLQLTNCSKEVVTVVLLEQLKEGVLYVLASIKGEIHTYIL